ncbi:hypothetical protein GCM10009753_24510 [Streptantibioticus ferralitis]
MKPSPYDEATDTLPAVRTLPYDPSGMHGFGDSVELTSVAAQLALTGTLHLTCRDLHTPNGASPNRTHATTTGSY